MVTQKSTPKSPFGKPIGHIRVSGRQLIDLLKTYESSETEVTAETKKHSFESVEDMEENISLLQGETTVKLRPECDWLNQIDVKFGYCTVVSTDFSSASDQNPQEVVQQRLEADLRSLRTPIFWPFTIVPRFVWWSVLIGSWVGVYFAEPEQLASEASRVSVFNTIFISGFVLSVAFTFVKPVHYARTDTFWTRNKDKILIGVAMLLLGALIAHFAPQIFAGGHP